MPDAPQDLSPRDRSGMAARLVRAYLQLVATSTRWSFTGDPQAIPILLQQPGSPPHGAIVAFWHSSILLVPSLWRWARTANPMLALRVLISRNRDGRLIADAIAPWGVGCIEGSSNRKGKDKGGARAFRQALRAVRGGETLVITPDGPRGPAETVQPGTMTLARIARCPVVPIGAASGSLRLPTWDRLALPLPFTRGAIIYGTPLGPDATDSDLAAALAASSRAAQQRWLTGRLAPSERLWALTGTLLAPALVIMLRVRLARGRERAGRLRERLGLTPLKRPRGRLFWMHAASVGECRSALPLVEAMLERHPRASILLTTATVTGADILADHRATLSSDRACRLFHQFIPYDVPRWIGRFLRHWRPEAALFMESELWPGIVAACHRRGVPVAVINGRLSDRSWGRWRKHASLARRMFSRLDFVAARSEDDAARFAALGVAECHQFGDLKQSAPPPSASPALLEVVRSTCGSRPVLLAVSTHPGEEEEIRAAATLIREDCPDLLCIIVPRHPARADDIAARLGSVPRRSRNETPSARDPIWLADTLGELGAFFRVATIAWIGHSMSAPGGGHNPYEGVRLGVPLATGPHIGNFADAYARLGESVAIVADAAELARWAVPLLKDPALRAAVAADASGRVPGHIPGHTPVPAPLLTRINAMVSP